MSKAKGKKGGKEEAETNIKVRKDIKEAKMLTLSVVEEELKFGKLNSVLLVSYVKDLIIGKALSQDQVVEVPLYGKAQNFKVIGISGDLSEDSQTSADKLKITEPLFKSLKDVQYLPIAGLEDEKNQLTQLVQLLQLDEEVLQQARLFLPIKGVLVYGPSGVGKTALIKDLARSTDGIEFLLVNSRDLLSKYVGESEKKIAEIFVQAKSLSPCVLIFDDFHVLSFKKDIGSENSSMILNAIVNEIDNITSKDRLLCIAITNQISGIDTSLRRAGRFEKEVKIETPNANKRLEILKSLLKSVPNNFSSEDLTEINMNLNGYTGADMMAVIREAIFRALTSKRVNKSEEIPENKNGVSFCVSKADIEEALGEVNPSGLKDIIAEIPKVFWKDIGGYDFVKAEIKKVIEWPLKHPEAFERMGIKPSRGVLLYGPPGCSKTMIAKAIATESKLNFIAIKGPELFNKYVGESEKAIRELFKRARLCSPCVIFFDEIDAIATQRSVNTDVSERVLIQLLTEMDGMESIKHVIVIAATNRPDILDSALMRPGRFDHLILVSVPDLAAREEILRLNTVGVKMPIDESVTLPELAKMTEKYTGAELVMICREAALAAMDRDLFSAKVSIKDFEATIQKIAPRIKPQDIEFYEKFAKSKKLF